MRIRRLSLQLNRQRCKQNDLHGSTTGIPERSRNSIVIRNARGLKKSRRPSPAGYDSRRHQSRLDRSTSSTEDFRSLQLVIVPLQHKSRKHHAKGEEKSQTDNDAIASGLREWWRRRHPQGWDARSIETRTTSQRRDKVEVRLSQAYICIPLPYYSPKKSSTKPRNHQPPSHQHTGGPGRRAIGL